MNYDARRLEDLLDREIEAALMLSVALAAERAALTGQDVAAVHEMAARKIAVLKTLEALETERSTLWASLARHPPASAPQWPSVGVR